MSPANDNLAKECTCKQILAIASVPKQPWMQPRELSLALKLGTIFENLDFPFYVGGEQK